MELSFTKASLSQHVAIDRLMRDAFTPYAKKLGRGDIYVDLDETEIVGVVASSRRAAHSGHVGEYSGIPYEAAASRTPVGAGVTHQPSGASAGTPPISVSRPSPSPSSTMSSG